MLYKFNVFETVQLGEIIKIVIEDYVNHLANYNLKLIYKPDLLFNDGYDYDNRIHLEFNHMYHWHPFNPDEYNISGTVYAIDDFLYHSEIVVKHGMREFVDSMSRSLAGKVKLDTSSIVYDNYPCVFCFPMIIWKS